MASLKPTHVLLLGATGNIGRHIAQAIFSARPAFPKVTVFTSPSTLAKKSELLDSWRAAGVSILPGDIASVEDVRAAFASGPDTVICSLGRGGLHLQMQLLRLAEESPGVRWFFPSEYGADTEHDVSSLSERVHQMKRSVHQFVREEIRRIKVTYVATGPYFDMWSNNPAFKDLCGGFDVQSKSAVIIGDGEQKISFTTRKDVGTAVVAALQHPEANHYIRISSFIVTSHQILAEFEAQVGAKFDVKYIPLAELEALDEKYWEEENPMATMVSLRRIAAAGGSLPPGGMFPGGLYPGGLENEALGLTEDKLETLSDAVRQQIAGVVY